MYLTGKDAKTKKYVEGTTPCELCKRFIINAGIKEIVIRDDKENYRIISTKEYIKNDDTLKGVLI